MANTNNELGTLLTSQLFSKLINSSNLKIVEFDALLTILIKAGIPFDVEYTPGTRRAAEAAVLIIYINPDTTLNLTFSFDGGGGSIIPGIGGTTTGL